LSQFCDFRTKNGLQNEFLRFKKWKSFECIFGFQKRIEITSIFKARVDTRFLFFARLYELNRKWCGHGTF